MRTANRVIWTFSIVLLLGLFADSAGPARAEEPKRGGTVIEAIGTEPTNLDCFKARRRPERTILHLMLEPLFVINPKLEVEPLLVESWKSSEGNKTWTFVLKEGIKFHDGTQISAEDVKFSLEGHMKGSQAGRVKGIADISVIDSRTFKITLTKPNPAFPTALASSDLGIVSRKAYEKAGAAWGSKVIVGTGPLMFKEWISGDRVILVRNPEYRHGPSWLSNRGPAYVDKWVIRFIPEPAILVGELTAGEVDLSDYVTERDVRRVRSNPNTGLIMAKSTSAIYLAINCAAENKPFDDVRVRRAMAHAINAEAVRKAAMAGIGEPLYTPFAPTTMGFWKKAEEIGKPLTEYDPELARKLLAEAGWKDTDGDGVLDKDGQPLTVNFLAFTIARYRRMAEVATPMLQKVGFKVDLKILEAGDLYERVLKGRHDLLSTGLVASQGIVLDDMIDTMHSGSIGSITQWCFFKDPKMDELLDKARFATDPEGRQKALRDAQELAASQVPVVPIALAMEIFGYKKKTIGGVENYTKHPWCFDQVDTYRALEIYKK
jgi:peptide/nickel transport system substrate-binding protein